MNLRSRIESAYPRAAGRRRRCVCGQRCRSCVATDSGRQLLGRGDWAYVFATPDRDVALRITPWDPAFLRFAQMCIAQTGNRLLPVVHRIEPLGPLGHAVWMERLEIADATMAAQFCAAIEPSNAVLHGSGDARGALDVRTQDIVPLRRLLDRAESEGAAAEPFWGGFDISPKNVLATSDGAPKLTDAFFLRGPDIIRALRSRDLGALLPLGHARLHAFLRIPAFVRGDALLELERQLERLGPLLSTS